MGVDYKPAVHYYRIAEDRIQYLGERYFRYENHSDICTQVCTSIGDIKKGKSNTFGIYIISKMTLFSNYLAPGYLQQVTKEEWDKQFEETLKALK